jgi:acetyl esterase/lipase
MWAFGVAGLLMTGAGPASGQGAAPAAQAVSLPAVEKDIPYASGGDEQKLDLYLPKDRGFATVVFTYGGGWHRGSRKSVTPIGERLQSLGFGCALLSHRLGPKERFPAQIEDVAAAFAWVKRNIAGKGGDPARVFLVGHSSGAQLSLLLVCDTRYLAPHELGPKDVAGVVGLSTPVELEPRKDGKGFGNALMAGRGADVFGRDVSVMKAASPIQHITRDLPPMLLVVGERDFPMLEGDNRSFVAKARALEIRADLFMAKGCDHMGVVRSLLEDKSPVQQRVIEFVSRR